MNTLVLWFTGLSGSGKTTISDLVHAELKKMGKKVMVIDGDVVRLTVHKKLGFTLEDIKENNRLISVMCYNNLGNYDVILVPIISPFRESRDYARGLLLSQFVEVYISAGIEECVKRDVKGLYKRALAGLIDNFIGIDPRVPYETPVNPELKIDTKNDDPESSANKILQYIFAYSDPRS